MTALAMQQRGIKPATKVVLYWLADHHNSETGACFPSLNTLANECEMDRSTVVRHLDALEKAGFIARDKRTRANGSQTSTAYILTMPPVAKYNSPCGKTQQPPVAKCDPHNLGKINLGSEPVLEANASKSLTSLKVDNFEEFWSRYPRKVAKPNAKKAYAKAIRKHRHDDIMFGLSQHLSAMAAKDNQFIPHPSTWLNGERFNDEPEPTNHGNGGTPATDGTLRAIADAAGSF